MTDLLLQSRIKSVVIRVNPRSVIKNPSAEAEGLN
jgi:hypothetical protein